MHAYRMDGRALQRTATRERTLRRHVARVRFFAAAVVAFVSSVLPGVAMGDGGTSTNLSMTVDPPPAATVIDRARRSAEFSIVVDPTIKTVRLSRSTLVDTRGSEPVIVPPDKLTLCPQSGSSGCKAELQLQPGRNPVWVQVSSEFDTNGVYTGSLEFEGRDGDALRATKTVAWTVYQSSNEARGRGVLLLVLGLAASWIVTVYGKARIARDQALLPAAVLRERAIALQTACAATQEPLASSFVATNKKLSNVVASLAASALDAAQYLPPAFPLGTTAVTRLSEYQTFLQSTSRAIDRIDTVVHVGLQGLVRELAAAAQRTLTADVQTAVEAIDAISSNETLDRAAAESQIRTQLADLHTKLAAGQSQRLAPAGALLPSRESSPFSLLMEIQRFSLLWWLVWGALTILVGAYMQIIAVPGFGTWLDYVKCVLWGFGLPTAGQALQQLTPASISTQLGISTSRT